MNTTTAPLRPAAAQALPAQAPATVRATLKLLQQLPHGQLELHTPDGHTLLLGKADASAHGPHAMLTLRDWRVFSQVQLRGDIGLAESFIDGDWDSPDLSGLLALFLANRRHIEALIYGNWWGGMLHRIRHRMRRNTLRGSERNIHAHYDLGNAFYKLWLDPSMNYSAAWFQDQDPAEVPLHEAQLAKMRRALDECGIAPGQRLLEIGCGWGAIAELAARDYQAQVSGVTLSREQLAWGQQRLQNLGLADRAQLHYQDYRTLAAQHAAAPFDAVVSIEMFEAVGEAYWEAYFRTLHSCLKPSGLACVQTITIDDALFERYRSGTDFIQQYVFPGGMLPSPRVFEAQANKAGFEVVKRLAFGADYAETLRRWRDAFLAALPQVQALGFDERFVRIWRFYLAYCEAGFDSGSTDVMQFTLRKR
ncbi:class I SAM-dependent methyltransferase [Roseateles sp. BYS180W]|uniref:Class I SAM-dependent methyltransferase n=1 Tax=Roseateles rivi TaxID=3299028 RepID=A0ABW7FS16_9BURK